MNPALVAHTKLPANQTNFLTASMKISSVHGLILAMSFRTGLTKLSGAIGRMVAGPPMSEQARYNQSLVEVKTRRLEGLTGSWIRPL